LVAAAFVLWAGDFLTVLLVLSPISGQSPARLLVALVRHSGLLEGAQYFVGLLGALAATQQIWALLLLALPTLLLYHGLNRHMDKSTRQTLESIGDAVDMRSPWTVGHSRRVAELAAGILRSLKLNGPETPLIIFAARVHDIGKISVPDQFLNKDAVLTPEERALIEAHPERGAELLMRYPDLAQVAEIVRHHHERWDGLGYPSRLAGTDVPFGARVVAVASSFAAMTSDRPYRRALSPDAAATILRDGRGRQWDPQIVDALLHSVADQLTPASRPHLHLVGGSADLHIQGAN
jgi:putative nucleotidyltransferase with HDIG domain